MAFNRGVRRLMHRGIRTGTPLPLFCLRGERVIVSAEDARERENVERIARDRHTHTHIDSVRCERCVLCTKYYKNKMVAREHRTST